MSTERAITTVVELAQAIYPVTDKAQAVAAAVRLAVLLGREPTTILAPWSIRQTAVPLLQMEGTDRGLWHTEPPLTSEYHVEDLRDVESDFPVMRKGCQVLVPGDRFLPEAEPLWHGPDERDDDGLVALRCAASELRPLSQRCALPLSAPPASRSAGWSSWRPSPPASAGKPRKWQPTGPVTRPAW